MTIDEVNHKLDRERGREQILPLLPRLPRCSHEKNHQVYTGVHVGSYNKKREAQKDKRGILV